MWLYIYIYIIYKLITLNTKYIICSITCNKHGSTNKSSTKLNTTENKFDIGDLFMNRENYQGKIPSGEFKVTTPENPLLSKQAVTSKMNLGT